LDSKLEIEVEAVNGHCVNGYKVGQKIQLSGMNTPDHAFCGGAYTLLFPLIVALNSGSKFDFEKNPYCKTKMACPDNGNVIFKITKLEA